MHKFVLGLVILIGIGLMILAGMYFITPANSLPHFIPGFDPQLTRHHYTHGIAALVIGLLAFTFAWFKTGKKSTK